MASLADQFLDDVESSSSEDADQTPKPEQHAAKLEDKPSTPDTPSPIPRATSEAILPLLSRIDDLPPGATDDPSVYKIVTSSLTHIATVNELLQDLHTQLKAAFAPRFPELETLITQPLDFSRVARLSADVSDLTAVDLRSVLPSGTVITVQLAFASTTGTPLSKAALAHVYTLCDALDTLDSWRLRLLSYVEDRAEQMAPNLVAIVGGAVAARLMALSGGLRALAAMPSCNVKLLGKRNAALQGTSTQTTRQHEGVVFTCPLVTGLPKSVRSKAGEVVSGKACLAARVDACLGSRDGAMGRGLREGLEAKFAKWMEPPPARTAKPLPVPGDEAKRRHRGGRRARKEKERLGITDVRRLANRVKFGEEEEVVGNDLESEGFGMLGKEGSGRLRVQVKKTDSVSVTMKRKLAKQRNRERRSEAEALGIGGEAVVAPDDTIELRLPSTRATANGSSENSTYFSASTPFLGVDKQGSDPKRPRKDANGT